jgi:SSS family solute:Na+ symporter/sodium/proline symporter
MASVAYLDLIIGLLVTVIALISVPLLITRAGGWGNVTHTLPPTHFMVLGDLPLHTALGYLLPTMMLLIGNQGMYQKFFSARSERDAKLAVAGWIVGTIILETTIITIAVVASSFLHPANPREIIADAARYGLPPLAGAVLLGGVFAKVISTANNFLFSPASNLIHDVYKRFLRPNSSERQTLFVSRVLVILLGVVALLQATTFDSILKAALYAYTVYGAAVTPAVMTVFFWKRANTAGAMSSIIAATVVTVAWNVLNIQTVEAIYPALGVSLAALIGVSLMTPPPPREKLEPFEK